MLNKVILMGRITKDLELKHTQSNTAVLSFSLAVERDFKGNDGERVTDFFNIVVWGKTAEFISQYFGKGALIGIEGNLQTRKYTTQNNEKREVTEVVAEKVHFTGEKRETAKQPQNEQNFVPSVPKGTEFLPQDTNEDLPF